MNHPDQPSNAPPRGFTVEEFEHRTRRAQRLMAEQRLDALLLSTEPEVRWFTGFLSQFWTSPTRPWFLVVPADGKPMAVIPTIGEAGMRDTWIDDVRTWPAPVPQDDGVSLLAGCLEELPRRHARIGMPMGHESHAGMPVTSLDQLREHLGNSQFVDARPLMRSLRSIKSEQEVDKIRHVCELTSRAFEALPAAIGPGMSERAICKRLTVDILERGADAVPFLVGASGAGSYDNIIMGPTDRVPVTGDVMIIDTGATFDGYFCDFDRNFTFGPLDDATRRAHEACWDATEAGIQAARPGATAADLHHAMWQVLEAAGALGNDVGRLGHGLGMQLTEGHSNMPGDDTLLRPGMVLTLEPGMSFAPGKVMVHEENLVIREDGAELLSLRASREMARIG
jgi:Xaa-Pro aminopeptidase